MKKPAKSKTHALNPEDPKVDGAQADGVKTDRVKTLCDGFVNSDFYKRAMTHPGYLREEAIRDFLISLNQLVDQAVVEQIRKNYYRSF